MEKQFPNLTANLNQNERFGGFDLIQNSNIPTHFKSGRHMHVMSVKWTQTHFSLKISADLEAESKHMVNWANIVQPKGVKTGQVFKPSMLGPVVKQVQHTQWPKPNRHPVFFNTW